MLPLILSLIYIYIYIYIYTGAITCTKTGTDIIYIVSSISDVVCIVIINVVINTEKKERR